MSSKRYNLLMKVTLPTLLLILNQEMQGQTFKSFNNGPYKLYYEERGKGQPLYILTGGPGAPPDEPSHTIMDSLKSHYTVVLLHQRGAGRSHDIPINEQTINIKSYIKDIELLRKARGDNKIILLGISWGGLLAMNYAADHPEQVSNLVLIGSAPPSYKVWDVLFDNQYTRFSWAEKDSMEMFRKIFSAKTDRELDSLKRVDPSGTEVQAFKQFLTIFHRVHFYEKTNAVKEIDWLFNGFNFQPIPFIDKEVLETKWDITGRLKKTNIPALILYGRQDDQGESTFQLQKECLRNSTVKVIEKCGHISWVDQPEQFYKILVDYLIRKKK